MALRIRPFADQRIGDLQQDSRTITQQRIGADSTAVIDILENFQRLRDDIVRSHTFDMRDKSDTTGVVFVTRVIQALGRWVSHSNSIMSDAGVRPRTETLSGN